MLFLVYLLLNLNITISFSNAVCKQAFFCLRMAAIVVSTITILYKCSSDYDYDYDHAMK